MKKKTVVNSSQQSKRGESARTKPTGKLTKPSKQTQEATKQAVSKQTAKKETTKTTASKQVTAKRPTAKPSSESKPAGGKSTKGVKLSEAGKKSGAKGAGNKSDKIKKTLVDQKTADEIMRLLCKKYPDAQCELTYKNDFELLTAVIMSAQTTDVQVNKVTPRLFERFPNANALANADPEEVREIIKPTGFFNAKANSIQNCASAIVKNFGGKVPKTLEELVTLPGVGRKTANVVLGVVHNIPGWAVDTHVQRLSQRLGLTLNEDPLKIEMDLQKLYPNQDWALYGITLIFHGRRLCYARKPDCPVCPVNHLCPNAQL